MLASILQELLHEKHISVAGDLSFGLATQQQQQRSSLAFTFEAAIHMTAVIYFGSSLSKYNLPPKAAGVISSSFNEYFHVLGLVLLLQRLHFNMEIM